MYESPPLSAYEDYGDPCGGRVKKYAVVACTDLEWPRRRPTGRDPGPGPRPRR